LPPRSGYLLTELVRGERDAKGQFIFSGMGADLEYLPEDKESERGERRQVLRQDLTKTSLDLRS
jgi:hypothetical protein